MMMSRRHWLACVAALLVSGCVFTSDLIGDHDMPQEVYDADPDSRVEDETPDAEPSALPTLVPDWTPAWWNERLDLTFAPMSLVDLLPLLTNGGRVRIAQDVREEWMQTGVVGGPVGIEGVGDDAASRVVSDFSHNENVTTRGEAVEHLCFLYDYWCDIEQKPGSALLVRANATVTYRLTAQPGEASGSMGVEGLSQTTGQSSASMDNAPYTSTLEPLMDILIADAPPGASYLLSGETNTLVVRGRPSLHVEVAKMVGEFNSLLALSVRVHVSVFELERDNQRGFVLKPNQNRSVVGESEYRTVNTIVNEAIQNSRLDVTYTVADAAGSFAVALNALAAIARTKVAFSETLETRNNVIITSQNTRTQSYVSGVTRDRETVQGAQVTQYNIETEEVETGWSVSVLPTVGDADIITIRVAISRQDLVSIDSYEYGDGASGNTFTTDQTNRQMSFTLRNGESRLVSALSTEQQTGNAGLLTQSGRNLATEFAVLVSASVVRHLQP